MPDHVVVDLAWRNLTEMIRRMAEVSGGETYERDGYFFCSSASPAVGGLQNVAIRMTPEDDPDVFMAQAVKYFGRRNRGFYLWTEDGRDSDLQAVARSIYMTEVGGADSEPIMALRLDKIETSLPPNMTVQKVIDGVHLEQFTHVASHIYADQTAIISELVSKSIRSGDANLTAWVLTLEGQPSSCAVTLRNKEALGIYLVGTVPERRRLGCASALLSSAIEDGRGKGAKLAVLESTETARSVYRNLGFIEVGGGPSFIAPTALCLNLGLTLEKI